MEEKVVDKSSQAIPSSVQKELSEKRSSKDFVNDYQELFTEEEKEKQAKVQEEYNSDSPTPTITKVNKDIFSNENIKKYEKEKQKVQGLDEVIKKMLDSKITKDSIPIIYREEVNM
jgi:competence protein ComGF